MMEEKNMTSEVLQRKTLKDIGIHTNKQLEHSTQNVIFTTMHGLSKHDKKMLLNAKSYDRLSMSSDYQNNVSSAVNDRDKEKISSNLKTLESKNNQAPLTQDIKESLAYLGYLTDLQRSENSQQIGNSNIYVNMIVGDIESIRGQHKRRSYESHESYLEKYRDRRNKASDGLLEKSSEKLNLLARYEDKSRSGEMERKKNSDATNNGWHFEALAKSHTRSLNSKATPDRPTNVSKRYKDYFMERSAFNKTKKTIEQVGKERLLLPEEKLPCCVCYQHRRALRPLNAKALGI